MKKKVEWLDFERPTEQDLESLKKKFGFHDIILKELREPSARSRVEVSTPPEEPDYENE
jgi:Mg2+ and Co2+ transporter CorA